LDSPSSLGLQVDSGHLEFMRLSYPHIWSWNKQKPKKLHDQRKTLNQPWNISAGLASTFCICCLRAKPQTADAELPTVTGYVATFRGSFSVLCYLK